MARQAQEEDLIPLAVPINGGMASGGDAAEIPSGSLRKVRNMLRKSGVWVKRPQFTYDNLTNIRSLFVWEDDTNKVSRLGSVDASGVLKVKATSGETWGSAASGTVGGARITASVTYRGHQYGVCSDANGVPTAAFSYDGSTVSSSPFNSAIVARCMTAFKERLYLDYPRVTVTPLQRSGTLTRLYDLTNLGWAKTNVTATNLIATVGGDTTTVCRLFPTSTAAVCSVQCNNDLGSILGTSQGLYDVPASEVDIVYEWRQDLKPVHASYRLPMTLEFEVAGDYYPGITPFDMAVGYIIVRPSGGTNYIYRCTTAGTVNGAEPAWTATIGGTSTWNGVPLVNIGMAVIGALPFTLPNASEFPGQWLTYWAEARAPWSFNGYGIIPRIKFANDAVALLTTLAPVDVSLKDGRADGSINKRNYGLQITKGEFRYPFFNTETALTSTIDLPETIWSEVGEPTRIRGANTYDLTGAPGYPTAAAVVGGRRVVFKRRSFNVFLATGDANNPILPDGDERVGVGCIGPRALDTFEEMVYFIGEREIYRWRPDMDRPEPLCKDAMRDEIMSQSSSSWVEAQSSPANVPLLEIDPTERLVYVYTQKGKWYVYDIDTESWAVGEVGGDTSVAPVGKQICDIAYNPNTGNMVFAFTEAAAGTAGIARMDASQAVAQDSISTSGTSVVHAELWPKPFELTGPRYEMLLDNVKIYHETTASQTGQTTTAYVSRDHGATFPKSNQVTLAPVSTGGYKPIRITLFQSWGSLLLRILHSGNGGAASFNVSRMEADVQMLSGEYTKTLATPGSATL